MTDTLATIALALSVFPASVVVKATAVLGGVSLGLRMLPRAPAPTRHLILASAFAVLAALPVTAVVAPALTVAIDGPAAAPPVILPITVAMPIDQPPSTSSAPAASAAADRSPGAAGWRAVGFAVWVAGVVVFLTPVVLTPLRLRRLQRTARHWHVGDTLLRQIPDGRRRAAVLLHEKVGAPLACGIVRPAIVLPGDAARVGRPRYPSRAGARTWNISRRAEGLAHPGRVTSRWPHVTGFPPPLPLCRAGPLFLGLTKFQSSPLLHKSSWLLETALKMAEPFLQNPPLCGLWLRYSSFSTLMPSPILPESHDPLFRGPPPIIYYSISLTVTSLYPTYYTDSLLMLFV